MLNKGSILYILIHLTCKNTPGKCLSFVSQYWDLIRLDLLYEIIKVFRVSTYIGIHVFLITVGNLSESCRQWMINVYYIKILMNRTSWLRNEQLIFRANDGWQSPAVTCGETISRCLSTRCYHLIICDLAYLHTKMNWFWQKQYFDKHFISRLEILWLQNWNEINMTASFMLTCKEIHSVAAAGENTKMQGILWNKEFL